MGVDAKLLVNTKWSVRDIQDVLKSRLGVAEQKINFNDWAPDYITIQFKFNNEDRMLHVHRNGDRYGGFDVMTLGLGMWGSSEEILRGIANVTGGFFQAADTNDEFEAIPELEDGNLKFLVKNAVVTGKYAGEIEQAKELLHWEKGMDRK